MMRSVSFTILTLCALVAAGCSEQSTAPADENSWDWVRLHDGETGTYSDLSIGSNGEFVLDTSSRGGASPSRGLLAGERLETLARVIGDLPLEAYSAPGSCDGDFFVSVTRAGEVTTYRSHDCDVATPAILETLRDLLAGFAAEIEVPQRLDPEAARVLALGSSSDIRSSREVVAENRDELFALLRQHQPRGVLALPPVDFGSEVVVGVFAGEMQSAGYELGLGPVQSGDNGWLTVQVVVTEPGVDCSTSSVISQPFLLLAVKRPGGGLVLDRHVEVINCGG